MEISEESSAASVGDDYVELVKRCVLNSIYRDSAWVNPAETAAYSAERRQDGRDWPFAAHTMVGRLRLDNVHRCVEDVLTHNVPGDLIETGVWRGGTTILMRAVLKARGVLDRTVWVADSFAGVPPPDADRYPADAGIDLYRAKQLAISLEEVQSNFEAYGLLDDQVRFLKGWFKDTLAPAPIDRLAVMRLDGDLYESTMDSLTALYSKLSPGGYVIIDDYGAIEACKQAVQDFRASCGISDKIVMVDWTGAYWQKQ